MSSTYRRRWSDNDVYFGPFTYARDGRGYRPLAVVLRSGDDEDYPGANLRVSGFGHTVILALPSWALRPHIERRPAGWDAATVKRLGRDWYEMITEREYGFTLSDGHLSVMLGRQTHDSSTEQRWGCFLPWTQWRHVRRSFCGLHGEHVATILDADWKRGDRTRWDREREIAEATPTVSFEFKDFDGERIVVTTRIEEREWRLGEGWFKWLSLFRKPRIRRSLDLRFSKETGRRKGSWKGGALGHGIEMLPGELHEAAFRRYCAKHEMTFIGAPPLSTDGGTHE